MLCRSPLQIVIASVIEDRIQRRYYMVPFSARVKRPKGTQRVVLDQ